jgi:serpin B
MGAGVDLSDGAGFHRGTTFANKQAMNIDRRRCAAALAITLASGCSTAEGPVTVEEARSQKARVAAPDVPAADATALADGNAAFAMALYRQVEAGRPNLVFSPVSVSTALAMTFAGARGQTEQQMAAALHFTLPQERLHPAMNALTAALAGRGAGKMGADGKPFRLRIVNSTWAQKGFAMVPAFLDVLAESYGAGVNLLDFMRAAEPSRQTINRWVSQETEERIKNLIPEGMVGPDTRLVLTNAVYFNAAWRTAFDAHTSNGPFTRPDGSTVDVPMMSLETHVPAATVPGLGVAVALPYQDERLSMLVVLPEPGALADVEHRLAADGFHAVDAALTEQAVLLSMPRFKFETPIDLKDALGALGMPVAFSDAADFSGISAAGGLTIGDVIHKAFIAVAEKGTEAAAATAVTIRPTSAAQGLAVRVDRPFLFFVRDTETGAILFLGRVSDPSAASGG